MSYKTWVEVTDQGRIKRIFKAKSAVKNFTVWNDRRIAIAKDIAAILRQRLTGAAPLDEKTWKEKGVGY